MRIRNWLAASLSTAIAVGVLAAPMTTAQAASDAGGADAFTYTGTWGGTAPAEKWSTTANSTATATVDVAAGGSTVAIYGNTDTGGGYAHVGIDGSSTRTFVDTYNSTPPPGVDTNWFTTGTLPAGRHTVTVYVLNQKRSAATGTAVSIKGVNLPNGSIVWPGSTAPTTPTTPPATTSPSSTDLTKFTSSGTWTKESNTKWYSETSGAYVTVPVKIGAGGGTVTLKGTKANNYGYGAFSVDGGAETQVNLYSSTRTEGTTIWTSPTLAAGDHVIKVRVPRTKVSSSTGWYVAVAGATTTNGVFGASTTTPTDPTTPPPAPAEPAPITAPPVAGSWTQSYAEDFNTLDPAKWQNMWYLEGGVMNNVPTNARNVTTANGKLELKLESDSSGALVHTDVPGGYKFPVGSYVEASVRFPGNGSKIYNWPAWWVNPTDDDGWPSSGEHDIAEGSSDGTLGVNYHGPNKDLDAGTPAGYWGDQYHRYGVHRKAGSADVYWDGKLVASYTTTDNGNPEILIFNVGRKDNPLYPMYGAGSTVRVDWVRAFAPSTTAPTTPTTPPASTPLSDPVKKEQILQFVGTVENGNKDWTVGYPYIEYGAGIGDTRGYTGGIVGWTTATFDMNILIKAYRTAKPGNVLEKWIPKLDQIDAMSTQQQRHDASKTLLGTAFEADFRTAGADPAFQSVQKAERDRMYWKPAYDLAVTDGLSPLGLQVYYDTSVNHGQGSATVGGGSFQGVRATALSKAKSPAQGGDEAAFLNAILDARWTVLTGWGDAQSDGRVPALRKFVTDGRFALTTPYSWNMYGTTHTISSPPAVR